MTPYDDRDLGQHWLRKWLVAWRDQPFTKLMTAKHQWDLVIFTRGQFRRKCSRYSYPWHEFQNSLFEISATTPRGQWINAVIRNHYHDTLVILMNSGSFGSKALFKPMIFSNYTFMNKHQGIRIEIQNFQTNQTNALENLVCKVSAVSCILIYHSVLCESWRPWQWSGPRLNIKTVLSAYGDFHVKDKTAVRTSYL